jgi:hypothetical protein
VTETFRMDEGDSNVGDEPKVDLITDSAAFVLIEDLLRTRRVYIKHKVSDNSSSYCCCYYYHYNYNYYYISSSSKYQ